MFIVDNYTIVLELKQKKSTATVFTDVDGEAESKFISQIAVDFNDAAIVGKSLNVGVDTATVFTDVDGEAKSKFISQIAVDFNDAAIVGK